MATPLPNPGYIPTRGQAANLVLFLLGGGALVGFGYVLGKHAATPRRETVKDAVAFYKKRGRAK